MALRCALEGSESMNATTRIIDLGDYDLPFCAGKDDQVAYPPGVFRFREAIRSADGILLGSPEYHGNVSGVLKNALDLTGFDEFEGKLVGLIGVSGGVMGAFDALNTLRDVGRALHAWVIPEQAAVATAWKVFSEVGSVQNPALRERLLRVGRQVAHFARLHKCADYNHFLRSWEEAPPNPGGTKQIATPVQA
jgi:NAD(P)H-dependent FMN reductase